LFLFSMSIWWWSSSCGLSLWGYDTHIHNEMRSMLQVWHHRYGNYKWCRSYPYLS
jgi:hypothetical protein